MNLRNPALMLALIFASSVSISLYSAGQAEYESKTSFLRSQKRRKDEQRLARMKVRIIEKRINKHQKQFKRVCLYLQK